MDNERTKPPYFVSPRDLRAAIRAGTFTGPTAGQAPGFVQTNVVILPADFAEEFAEFCRLNDRPCPLVAMTTPGDACPREAAADADLRTDLPRYRAFENGVAEQAQPTDIRDLWRDGFVGFLLGCSFTFETALQAAGLSVRHIDEAVRRSTSAIRPPSALPTFAALTLATPSASTTMRFRFSGHAA
jgi:uncharacterized protein YcsI (UPF0317 family)